MSPAGSKRSTFTAPVKLVTWNVNSLKARLPRVLDGIERNYRKLAKRSDHAARAVSRGACARSGTA